MIALSNLTFILSKFRFFTLYTKTKACIGGHNKNGNRLASSSTLIYHTWGLQRKSSFINKQICSKNIKEKSYFGRRSLKCAIISSLKISGGREIIFCTLCSVLMTAISLYIRLFSLPSADPFCFS